MAHTRRTIAKCGPYSSVDSMPRGESAPDAAVGRRSRPSSGSRMKVANGRPFPPFTMAYDWVALSGISGNAKALYWHLAMHVNIDSESLAVWPSRETLANLMGYSRPQSVDKYIDELESIGAIDVLPEVREDGGKSSHTYVVNMAPPAGYSGPLSLRDYYGQRDAQKAEKTTSNRDKRRNVAAQTHVRQSAQGDVRSGTHGDVRQSAHEQHEGEQDEPPLLPPQRGCAAGAGPAPKEEGRTKNPKTPRPADVAEKTPPDGAAVAFLRSLPDPWRIGKVTLGKAAPAVTAALSAGWTPDALRAELARAPQGINHPGAVLLTRLADLPEPPRPAPPAAPACPEHPGVGRRGAECAGCWADRQG